MTDMVNGIGILKSIVNKFRKSRLRYLILIAVLVVATYLLAKRDTTKTITVKKVIIEDRIVEKTVSATGYVHSEKEAELSFGATGEITNIYVKEGQLVTKGKLLAELDASAFQSALTSAKDTRDVAKEDLDLFIQKYENHKSLLGGNDEYEISLRRQQELLNVAEANYQTQLNSISKYYIYAPYAATVYELTKKENENTALNEPVIKIADLSDLQFESDIDQEDFGGIAVGQNAYVSLDAYPSIKLKASVKEIPVYADGAGTAKFKIKIVFTDIDRYKPMLGMSGDAHITTSSSEKAVPSLLYDQIFFDEDDAPYIWTLENGYITKYKVKLGLEGDVYYELTEKPDKEVIIGLNDTVTVKDGYKGKLVK